MPHLLFTLSWCDRLWNQRLVYLASLLMLLLQRTPVLRVLTESGPMLAMPRFAHLLKFSSAASVVHVAGAHAVTGATAPEVTPVSPSSNPADATIGEPFVWVFSATVPGKKARSYRVQGLPPGVGYDGKVASNSFAALQGTPTTPGSFTVEITAFHFANQRGEASPVYSLDLNVTGEAVAAPLITRELTSELVTLGASLTLSVETEDEGLDYAWEKDGVPLENARGPALEIAEVTADDAGTYRVTVANEAGEAHSTAQVTVTEKEIPLPEGLTLYSISPRDAQLRVIDPGGATASMIPIVMDDHEVTGGTGLATDPQTGILHAILRLSNPLPNTVGDRVLATIDPFTGQATLIGAPSSEHLIKLSGLAFDPEGQLFGVTGDDQGATAPETLFLIDPATGAATEFMTLGNGDQGEAIAFDPASGLLVHASGGASPQEQVLETIDLSNQTITPVALQSGWSEGRALAALSPGLYLLADEDAFYLISENGGLTPIAALDHISKGLALAATGAPVGLPVPRIEFTADAVAILTFSAAAGEHYRIESSEDLLSWTERAQITVEEGQNEVEFQDPEISPGSTVRFYRGTRD